MKTITLDYDEDKGSISICLGHVDCQKFIVAFKAEGWDDDQISEHDLSHEYWTEDDDGKWKQSGFGMLGVKPVTIMRW